MRPSALLPLLVISSLTVAGCPEKGGAPGPASGGGGAAGTAGPAGGGPGPALEPSLLLSGDLASYRPIDRLEPMKVPAENPLSLEKANLGWQLYFDKRLSGDGTLACYSCHVNEKGLTDGKATAVGAFGKPVGIAAPTMWNVGYHAEWYWNGRAKTLEAQALAAWKGVNMGGKDPEKDAIRPEILQKLGSVEGYKTGFQKVFGGPPDEKNVSAALAAYMRTIVSRETPWDRFQRGEASAVSEAAKKGYEVFQKAKCDGCHSGVLFTDLQFHNIGIGQNKEKPDEGRFAVTKQEKDMGAFKTPTLRDVVDSAPYFHDGSVASLKDAVRLMLNGGIENAHLDRANLKKAEITDEELAQLLEFLAALDEKATLKEPTPQ